MYIPGCDKESKILRKTLVQNCNLMAVLVFRSISESVERRLKTLDDVVSAGIKWKAFDFISVFLILNWNILAYLLFICLEWRFHDLCRNGVFQGCKSWRQFVLVTRSLVHSSTSRSSNSRTHHWSVWFTTYNEGILIVIIIVATL